MSEWSRSVCGALLVAGILAPALAAPQERAVQPRTVYEDLQLFSQVLNQIRVNHPDSVDTHRLFMAAVEAMVRAADPHSYVLPARRLSPEKERALRDGRLVPVPITFRFVGGAAVVTSVEPGSGAAELDILPGDELLAVDSLPVTVESAGELDVTLAGPRGSPVTLSLERRREDGSLVRLERVVARERVDGESAVPAAFMLEPGTGYVRVTTFAHPRAADDLHAALRDLERQGMERLLLDLRDNGGGLLDEATRVASEFLPRGTVVYTAEGRKAEVADTGRVQRSFWRSERRYPMIVLTNEGTASASELVAGALQDHDRALIVGRTTFGKALLMQGFPMTDGSVMVLVVGEIRTPCGRSVQRDYRTITRREYYRGTIDERERAARPTCTTAGGRTVHGGGGIYPDVVLEEAPVPLWLARFQEQQLALRWVAGYLDSNPDAFTDLETLAADPRLPRDAAESFLGFAREQGLEVMGGGDSLEALERVLLPHIAGTLWGRTGRYRTAALLDPEVARAAGFFGAAAEMLSADR
jgi:carboxyl-terminal processing protease